MASHLVPWEQGRRGGGSAEPSLGEDRGGLTSSGSSLCTHRLGEEAHSAPRAGWQKRPSRVRNGTMAVVEIYLNSNHICIHVQSSITYNSQKMETAQMSTNR